MHDIFEYIFEPIDPEPSGAEYRAFCQLRRPGQRPSLTKPSGNQARAFGNIISLLRRSIQIENLERRQVERIRVASFKNNGWLGRIFLPGRVDLVALGCAGRQLKGPRNIERVLLRMVARIAEGQNRLFRSPGRPSIHFKMHRIASNPMRIDQNRRITSRPPGSFCKRVPVRRGEQ